MTSTVLKEIWIFTFLAVLTTLMISTAQSPVEPVQSSAPPPESALNAQPESGVAASPQGNSQPTVAVNPQLNSSPGVGVSPQVNSAPGVGVSPQGISAPGVTGTVTEHRGPDGSIITVSRFNGNIPQNAFPSFPHLWGNLFNPAFQPQPQQFQGVYHGVPNM